MYNQKSYRDLQSEGYTGDAYNVYYEFGLGDEWWGHNGEYADELDAWFLYLDEARRFADDFYGDAVMEDMLYSSPAAGGADKVMLCIRQWHWNNGCDDFDGDELFATYEKQYDGTVARTDGSLR